MRYCTTTLASAGLVVQPAAAVCGLHCDGQRGAGGIILRDRAAIVGRSGNGDVHGCGAIGEPDDGVGGAAARRGFRLHV